MNRRLTGRIAGAATVLALAGGGVAVAASNSTDSPTPAPPDAPYAVDPQAPGPPPGMPGRWHGGSDGPHPAGPGGSARGFGFGPPGGGVGPGELTETAARYLGLTEEQLHERLRDGRSLAEVASAEGRSVDGLEEAIVAAAAERLDRAVDDGWLGPKARDAALERLRDHVDELVAGTPPAGRPGRPHLRFKGECVPGEARASRARAGRAGARRADRREAGREGSGD